MDKESAEKTEMYILSGMYDLYVKSALRVSATRMAVTVFLILLNTWILMEINFASKSSTDSVVGLLTTLLNFWWSSHITSSIKLNRAKFKVIHEMEEELPYAPFKREERFYISDKRRDISSVEKYLPFLFIMLHLLIRFIK